MKKRFLALLAALSLLATLLCTPAFAEQSSRMDNFKVKKNTYTGFTDVPEDAWCAAAVKSCYEAGLMQGTSAATFNPKGNLSTAAALVMACRVRMIYGGGDPTILDHRYPDKPWYWAAYEYAMSFGILDKETMGLFAFDKPVTRRQMAYLFARAINEDELPAINTIDRIPDVERTDVDKDFSREIYLLYQAGVLTGSDLYGTFHPDDTITRQAACAIIARIAFPEQRQKVELCQRCSVGAMEFAMPSGTTQSSEGETQSFDTPDGLTYAAVFQDTQTVYAGFPITMMPVEELEKLLLEETADGEATAEDLRTETVHFGSCDAYRCTFSLNVEQIKLPSCAYFAISGSTLYIYVLSTASGADTLQTLANSVTLNGSPVSAKL